MWSPYNPPGTSIQVGNWGRGSRGAARPVGSAPTLLSNPHLKLAAGGGKMMWVGVSTKLGRTQRQPPALASWEDALKSYETPKGVLSHLVPMGTILSKLAANQPSSYSTPFEMKRVGVKASGQSVLGVSFYSYWQIQLTDGCRPRWEL